MKSYWKRLHAQMLHSPAGSSGACGCTWSWSGSAWWPAGSGTAPSWAIPPSCTTTARLISGRSGPSSWATSSTVPPPPTKPRSAPANASWLAASTPAVGSSRTSSSGCAGQRPGDQGALLLAAGEGGDRVAGPVGEPDGAQRRGDRGPVGRARRAQHAPAGQPPGGDHLADGGRYAAAGAEALRDVPDARATAGSGAAGVPKRVTDPAPSGTRPSTARIRVDLPEPLAPRTATTSPAVTVSETSRSTGRPS